MNDIISYDFDLQDEEVRCRLWRWRRVSPLCVVYLRLRTSPSPPLSPPSPRWWSHLQMIGFYTSLLKMLALRLNRDTIMFFKNEVRL